MALDLLLVNPGNRLSQFGNPIREYIQNMLKRKIERDAHPEREEKIIY